MLLLFDIDATMIVTQRSGLKAMLDAGRELYGPAFTLDGIEFAGRLDPLIFSDAFRNHGIPDSEAVQRQFREVYARHLFRRLQEPNVGRALPGVLPLLDALRGRNGLTLGVLTGNFEETGSAKLRACGIDPDRFTVRVWGDDSPHNPPRRDHLPPVAFERYRRFAGAHPDPSRTVIIGDTPHDVACAKAHGCKCLGVGTGLHRAEQLLDAGADFALPDLSDTDRCLAWLLDAAGCT